MKFGFNFLVFGKVRELEMERLKGKATFKAHFHVLQIAFIVSYNILW